MHDFQSAAPSRANLDPSKRVNYTLGLVLGVDEFDQEQTYFIERHRQHNRELFQRDHILLPSLRRQRL